MGDAMVHSREWIEGCALAKQEAEYEEFELIVSLSACASRFSEETPPADAKPLSEIVKSLEEQGYKDVERIKFDDNV